MTRIRNPAASDVMQSTFPQKHRVPLLVSCVIGLLLALHFFRPPAGGLWNQVFFDSLHVPVFGLIAVFIYLAQGARSTTWKRRAFVALLITVVLGMLSEAAQIFTSRDASLRDLVADCVGAVSFLAMFQAIWPPPKTTRKRQFLFAGTALLLLGWILTPFVVVSAAHVEQYSQFPTVARFDSRFGHVLKRTQNIDYRVIASADGDPAYAVVILKDKPWPGIAFHDIRRDWSEYSTLVIDLWIEGDAPLPINLRVHDDAHKLSKTFSDRFNRSYSLQPGSHTLRIPLTDLVNAPLDRRMDLTRISEIIVFSDASNAGRSFKLYEIRLE